MHTLTQCNENKQNNKFKTVAGIGAVINNSLETDRPVSAKGTTYFQPHAQRQMKIFTFTDWLINQTANMIFYTKSLELAFAGQLAV